MLEEAIQAGFVDLIRDQFEAACLGAFDILAHGLGPDGGCRHENNHGKRVVNRLVCHVAGSPIVRHIPVRNGRRAEGFVQLQKRIEILGGVADIDVRHD